MANLMNKECLVTAVLVIVGIVILLWLFFPMASVSTITGEGFNGGGRVTTMEEIMAQDNQVLPEEAVMPEDQRPYVDVKTGSIMDGPGFERGFEDRERSEVEGVPANLPPSIPSNYYFLDDGAGGEMSIQHNLCSKSCCSEQWPE
jgi:hypothetical protein